MVLLVISMAGFVNILQGQTTKEEREAARDRFNQEYNNQLKIRWNYITGTPYSIVGRITKYSGTPEQIARAFLTEEKTMLGILDPENDVALTKTSGSSVHFEQRYNSVPMLKAGYVVSMDNTGAIYYVGGDWYPEASVETNPNITESQAASVINGDLAGKQPNMKQEPTLSILPETLTNGEIQYRLIYKARVSAMDESWMYYISAVDGSIVEKIDMIMDWPITGYGGEYEVNTLPSSFALEQNYPNPFNPVTTINFQLPKASNVTLVIYNIQGQEVAWLVDGYVVAGYHSVNWDASNAASGIYIYRLQSRLSGFSDTKRMLYIK